MSFSVTLPPRPPILPPQPISELSLLAGQIVIKDERRYAYVVASNGNHYVFIDEYGSLVGMTGDREVVVTEQFATIVFPKV